MSPRSSRRPPWKACAAVCVALLVASVTGCAGMHRRHMDRRYGYTSDADTTQVVTTLIGGKNVFIPSTIVVTSGTPHTLSIFNTTDIPHGFRIPSLGIEAVLPPQQETRVELPALDARQVLRIDCHLHPPHRTATLLVVPGKR